MLNPLATCAVIVTGVSSQVSPQLIWVLEVVTLSNTGPCGVGWIREVGVAWADGADETTVSVGANGVSVKIGMRPIVGVTSAGVIEGATVDVGIGVSVGADVGDGSISVGWETAGTNNVGVAGIKDGVEQATTSITKIERIK